MKITIQRIESFKAETPKNDIFVYYTGMAERQKISEEHSS